MFHPPINGRAQATGKSPLKGLNGTVRTWCAVPLADFVGLSTGLEPRGRPPTRARPAAPFSPTVRLNYVPVLATATGRPQRDRRYHHSAADRSKPIAAGLNHACASATATGRPRRDRRYDRAAADRSQSIPVRLNHVPVLVTATDRPRRDRRYVWVRSFARIGPQTNQRPPTNGHQQKTAD